MLKKRFLALVLAGTMAFTSINSITAFAANPDTIVIDDAGVGEAAIDIDIQDEDTEDENENDDSSLIVVDEESGLSLPSINSINDNLDYSTISNNYNALLNNDSDELVSPNVSILLSLIIDRHYVVETFTSEYMPESNPYSQEVNEDYIYEQLYYAYTNDQLYNAYVTLWYLVENKDKIVSDAYNELDPTITKILELLDDICVFANLTMSEEEKADFTKGVAPDNYEAVLNSAILQDYTSSLGISVNSESAGLESLRSNYNAAKAVGNVINNGKALNSLLKSAENAYETDFIVRSLPGYYYTELDYLDRVQGLLDQAEKYGGDDKKYSTIFDLERAAGMTSREEECTWENAKALKEVFKAYSFINSIPSDFLKAKQWTLQDIMLIEALHNQSESLCNPIRKTNEIAKDNDDKAYAAVSQSYINRMSMNLDDDAALSLYAKNYFELLDREIAKYIEGKVEKTAYSILPRIASREVSNKATAMCQAQVLREAGLIIEAVMLFEKILVGNREFAEKLIQIFYLKQIKHYAITVYGEDYTAFVNAYLAGKSMDELDPLAKDVLDDLEFLKRLTLRANELGYQAK